MSSFTATFLINDFNIYFLYKSDLPTHILDPNPNGSMAKGCFSSPELRNHLSGLKDSGSGKYFSL